MLKEWLNEHGMKLTIMNVKLYQKATDAKLYGIHLIDKIFYLSETPIDLNEVGNKEFVTIKAVDTEKGNIITVTIGTKYIISISEF